MTCSMALRNTNSIGARSKCELGRLEIHPPHTRARLYRRAIAFNRAARRMARRVLQRV